MINFKTYIQESSAGNYVSINCEPVIIPDLQILFPDCKIVAPEQQHVTLMYSTDSGVSHDKIADYLSGSRYDCIKAVPHGVTSFNSETDPSMRSVVIELESLMLDEIHHHLGTMGLKHSYPEYRPHVSIAYDVSNDRHDSMVSYVREHAFKITHVSLSKFNINPIIEDWKAQLK